MQKFDEIDDNLQLALMQLDHSNLSLMMSARRNKHIIPAHVTRMKVKGTIKQTVVPPIKLTSSQKPKNGEYITGYIHYYLGMGDERSFPLAHIFAGGSICVGSLPIPAKTPEFDPLLPLETLFLYNDRRISHGSPKIIVDGKMASQIKEILSDHNVNVKMAISPGKWHADDSLWELGAQVIADKKEDEALIIMHQIFNVIFPTKKG